MIISKMQDQQLAQVANLLTGVEKCLIPKLAQDFDVAASHVEYEHYKENVKDNFWRVKTSLKLLNLTRHDEFSIKPLAVVYILYKELLSEGPWQTEDMKKYAEELNALYETLYGVKAEDLLNSNSGFDVQAIFDECMRRLHFKLTSTEFKRYPGLIQVYCMMHKELMNKEHINASLKTLPIALYLINDHILAHKRVGMYCCLIIMLQWNVGVFHQNNYYEYISTTLLQAMSQKDFEVKRLVVLNLLLLHGLMSPSCEFTQTLTEEIFFSTIHQIKIETNLKIKGYLFHAMRLLMTRNGADALCKHGFLYVACENLELCCGNPEKEDILLGPLLACFSEWAKRCWCIWRLKDGRRSLCALFKVILTCKSRQIYRIALRIAICLVVNGPREDKELVQQGLSDAKKQVKAKFHSPYIVNRIEHVSEIFENQ